MVRFLRHILRAAVTVRVVNRSSRHTRGAPTPVRSMGHVVVLNFLDPRASFRAPMVHSGDTLTARIRIILMGMSAMHLTSHRTSNTRVLNTARHIIRQHAILWPMLHMPLADILTTIVLITTWHISAPHPTFTVWGYGIHEGLLPREAPPPESTFHIVRTPSGAYGFLRPCL